MRMRSNLNYTRQTFMHDVLVKNLLEAPTLDHERNKPGVEC